MATTVANLKRFLADLPDDLEVKIRIKDQDRSINGLLTTERRVSVGQYEVDTVTLSSNYYGA